MTRADLWKKQVGQCWYCGEVVCRDEDRELGADGWPQWPDCCRAPEVDHQHPRSRGGKGGANLVLACAPCNNAKGSLTVDEYRERLWLNGADPVEFFGESAF